MENYTKYGIHRVLEPKYILPQPAWKLDNVMEVQDNEVLIQVKTININSSSFRQICTEYDNDIDKIKDIVLQIVELRGKLHNPITNTGGILFGQVKKIGTSYENLSGIKEGDFVIPLVSLSMIPLKINKINHIDIKSSQLQVDGEAILFPCYPLVKINNEIKVEHLLTLMDEAGSCTQSYNLAKKGDNILVMGAYGKIGLLCAFAVKEKIGKEGKIAGIVYSNESKLILDKYDVYDKVYVCDATKPIESYKSIIKREENLFDLTINCINTFGTEDFSILATKNKGTIYFSNLTTNYNTACLTAEGIGKDINIVPYKGYVDGHSEFAKGIFVKYSALRELIELWMKKDVNLKINKEQEVYVNERDKFVKEINIEEYVFNSAEINNLLAKTLKIAKYECNSLITGESGVGKEIFAHVIYKASLRNQGPYIKINCSSIPENLLESELFGYEKGAFTGANREGKKGYFELANGGTLFLDEIGELPLSLQSKFLRAIQEKEIYRVGGIVPIKVDVRIIAATNRDLASMVKQNLFREDLYYRLNVLKIHIPALNERRSDIIPLVKHFTEKYNKRFSMAKFFENSALLYMMDCPWDGNIRELENLVQRLLITTDKNNITVLDVMDNLDKKVQSNSCDEICLEDKIEKTEYIILKEAKIKYKTTRRIAEALGISQSSIVRKLKKYNL